jgi:hypothetical protein|tara:strand:+ start:362 stop:628 length:267 start_codon:yes stop_codon:yes gene_type:complete
MEQQELNLKRKGKGKKQIVVDPVDIGKLTRVLDNLMYVDRSGAFAIFPEDTKDLKAFLLKEISKYLQSVIETEIEENPEGAKYYRLTD